MSVRSMLDIGSGGDSRVRCITSRGRSAVLSPSTPSYHRTSLNHPDTHYSSLSQNVTQPLCCLLLATSYSTRSSSSVVLLLPPHRHVGSHRRSAGRAGTSHSADHHRADLLPRETAKSCLMRESRRAWAASLLGRCLCSPLLPPRLPPPRALLPRPEPSRVQSAVAPLRDRSTAPTAAAPYALPVFSTTHSVAYLSPLLLSRLPTPLLCWRVLD